MSRRTDLTELFDRVVEVLDAWERAESYSELKPSMDALAAAAESVHPCELAAPAPNQMPLPLAVAS